MTVQKRRWWAVAAAGLVVVAVVVAVPVWRSVRSGDAAGTQVQVGDSAAPADARTGALRLPIGDLTVVVGRPETHFPRDADPSSDEFGEALPDRVEGGGRWLAVGWTLRALSLPASQQLVLGRAPEQFQVVLVADGTRHDLAAGKTEDPYATKSRAGVAGRPLDLVDHKRLYVALPKSPESLSVEVAYDGVTQRFDPDSGRINSGPAAPLYRSEPDRTVRAPETADLAAPGFGVLRDSRRQVQLAVRPTTAVPYVPGLGWAQPGRTWLAVPVFTQLVDPFVFWPTPEAEAHALYRLQLRSTTVTLDGRRATRELPYNPLDPATTTSTSRAYYLWDVPAGAAGGTLRLHQTFASGPPTLDGPAAAPKQATATADATATIS